MKINISSNKKGSRPASHMGALITLMARVTCRKRACNLITANLSEVRSWLEIVYGDMPGYLNICSTGDWEGRCFEAGQIDEAVAYVEHLDRRQPQGIYARVTSLRELPAEHSRGTEAQTAYLPGLWADVDIAGPGHKTSKPLPTSVEQGMEIITNSGLPEPTLWVMSGGGLYPWWLLSEAAQVNDLEAFKILSSQWQQIIEHASKEAGFSYGTGVKDLSRVLRIPGTVNRKEAGNPRACTVLNEHSSGRQYALDELVDAALACLPTLPIPAPRKPANILAKGAAFSSRPGDDFNARADWRDLLADWEWLYQNQGTWYLRRPGKRDGISATIGHSTDGVERLWVFSDATEFEQNRPYDKYGAYALLEHRGDFRAATKALAGLGFGDALIPRQRQDNFDNSTDEPARVVEMVPAPEVDDLEQMAEKLEIEETIEQVQAAFDAGIKGVTVKPKPRMVDWTHVGAGRYLAARYADRFHEIYEEKGGRGIDHGWRFYEDGSWKEDLGKRVMHAVEQATDDIRAQASELLSAAEAAHEDINSADTKKTLKITEKHATFATSCASDAGIKAIANRFSAQPGVARSIAEFDTRRELLCLDNGTFDLTLMKLRDHDPKDLLTRRMNVTFDAEATCPGWEKAVEGWLPDPLIRAYVQRAMGYTLLGTVDEGVFFVPWGETGCGKSQFIEVMKTIFGDFGTTAEASTFRDKLFNSSDSTNNLHDLRGKRFVASSETSKGAGLNEELIKRATGDDALKTRALYQSNMDWKPEFVLWLATNFKPSLSAEDGAIWRRVKPIHFPANFSESADRIRGLARKLVETEASGILNWLLAGAQAYLADGLGEPESMTQAIKDYRDENDPVTQFLVEAEADGRIALDPEFEMEQSKIYNAFANYCLANNLKPMMAARFGRALTAKGFDARKGTAGVRLRKGIKILWMAEQAPPRHFY